MKTYRFSESTARVGRYHCDVSGDATGDYVRAEVARELLAALAHIESLEARADETAGLVDDSHVKALRAAAKIARAALAAARA